MKDEEYEKMVQAQIEANKRIKEQDAKSTIISTLVAIVIFIIIFIIIWNWLKDINPSFTMEELFEWFGFSYN